jgi:hypothetical protein
VPVELRTSPSRERILKAVHRRELPDMVPVEIGIGPWYACKLLGATTVDLMHDNPSVADVMEEAYRRYRYDPWLWCVPSVWLEPLAEVPQPRMEVVTDTKELHVRRFRLETPHGELTWGDETTAGLPTRAMDKPVKDPERDFPRLAWWLEPRGSKSEFSVNPRFQGKGLGGPGWCLPISWWEAYRDGNIEAVTFDIATQTDFMDGVFQWYREATLAELDAVLAARPREALDEITIQGSASSLSYSSLRFFREYDLPWLKEVTRRTKAAGVLTHLHVCGRSREIVELVHAHTDVDVMEPIEPPPGGNVDLAEAKRRFGDKLALKGNLNTFKLLTYGTVAEVREAAKRCLEAAMEGGGFWLATGDQTPANAPEENLVAVIETAREYGRY